VDLTEQIIGKMTVNLPKEMWITIWSYVDFKTLQKSCVLVSKFWLKDIRESVELSGKLFLKNDNLDEEFVKTILSNWKMLKVLHLSKRMDHLDLASTHKILEKLVVPVENLFINELKDHPVEAKKIFINPKLKTFLYLNKKVVILNPKNKSIPVPINVENVIELRLNLSDIEILGGGLEDGPTHERLAQMKPLKSMNAMKNLERLHIYWTIENSMLDHTTDQIKEIIEPLFQGLAFSTNLQEIFLEDSLFSMLGDLIVRYLPQIRKLKFADVRGKGFYYWPELNWLPDLKCLNTLVLSDLPSDLVGGETDPDEELAPFYKSPMTRLKRLELEGHVGNSGIFDFFPCLETLTITSGILTLPIQDLIRVLNYFGDVKNLSLSNINIGLTGLESYNATMESNIFQEAVKIIDGKFPVETTQIKIRGKNLESNGFAIIKEKGSQPFMKVF